MSFIRLTPGHLSTVWRRTSISSKLFGPIFYRRIFSAGFVVRVALVARIRFSGFRLLDFRRVLSDDFLRRRIFDPFVDFSDERSFVLVPPVVSH